MQYKTWSLLLLEINEKCCSIREYRRVAALPDEKKKQFPIWIVRNENDLIRTESIDNWFRLFSSIDLQQKNNWGVKGHNSNICYSCWISVSRLASFLHLLKKGRNVEEKTDCFSIIYRQHSYDRIINFLYTSNNSFYHLFCRTNYITMATENITIVIFMFVLVNYINSQNQSMCRVPLHWHRLLEQDNI